LGAFGLSDRELLKTFDLVVIGHITIDRIIVGDHERFALGGPPAYAMIAPALGVKQVAIISRIGKEFPEEYYEKLRSSGLNLEGLLEGTKTTQFSNIYTSDGNRAQQAEYVAEPITIADIPDQFWNTDWMHMSPVLQEVDSQIIKAGKRRGTNISVDAQGFIRKRISDQDHHITPCQWKTFSEYASSIDVLKADVDEIRQLTGETTFESGAKEVYEAGCKFILITHGQRGSYLFQDQHLHEIPAIPSRKIVDFTGSGDTFAISFLIELQRTGRPLWASFFASASASFNVETLGPTNFPSHDAVQNRLRTFLALPGNQQYVKPILDEPGPTDCPL
jgi:sugar/nucleoside kinase (ribokinase family)